MGILGCYDYSKLENVINETLLACCITCLIVLCNFLSIDFVEWSVK